MASRTDAIERWGSRIAGWSLIRPRAADPLPLSITRRRIYVLPTVFGMFIAAILGGLVLGALNYNNNPGLILAFLLTAVAHNSLVHAHLLLSGLRVASLHAEPVHAGQVMTARLRLENPSTRQRTGLELLVGDATQSFALSVHSATELELRLPTQRRGWLVIDRLRISTLRPLGLAIAWCWLRPDTSLLVYPALESNAPPLPSALGDGDSARSRSVGEQPHHLRDYRPGDPPRQIAWKASARADRLLVREYEASTSRELELDWFQLPALNTETRISRLARWVIEAERCGSRYQLILPGQRLGPGRGPEHRHACLRALALLPAASMADRPHGA